MTARPNARAIPDRALPWLHEVVWKSRWQNIVASAQMSTFPTNRVRANTWNGEQLGTDCCSNRAAGTVAQYYLRYNRSDQSSSGTRSNCPSNREKINQSCPNGHRLLPESLTHYNHPVVMNDANQRTLVATVSIGAAFLGLCIIMADCCAESKTSIIIIRIRNENDKATRLRSLIMTPDHIC